MTCKKHGAECPNFEKLMTTAKRAGELRVEVDVQKGIVRRLQGRLARVGVRDVDAPEYRPPDTRPGCWVQVASGQCGQPAMSSGLCAAHEADEVGL